MPDRIGRLTLAMIAVLDLGPAGGGAAQHRLPGQIIDVVADNYFFYAPETVKPGLTTFRLHSPHGGHEMRIVRLDSAHTPLDLFTAMRAGKPAPWATTLGGPAFPPAGGTANVSVVLEPGRYALFCLVHAADGEEHYRKGMFTGFSVPSGPRIRGSLPTPDVVVTMLDSTFEFSIPISAGRKVLRVVNAGTGPHEFKVRRVLPRFTVEDALAWKRGSRKPKPDVDFGAVGLAAGTSIITTMNFTPGDYLIVCVIQVKHGMIQAMRVARGRLAHSVTSND